MSRSYRKFPVMKENSHHREKSPMKAKDFANRAVRRYKDIPTGKSCFFKKIYCSWFISDYRVTTVPDEKEFKRRWEQNYSLWYIRYSDNYYNDLYQWKKYYIRK
ncbi:MAG: hypothetical protein K2J39_13700 [Ruminococcus sp.]|nr:hypothetical protein [Ruminococcus sp.]